ncbi:MAG: hypothetical protein ACYC77_12065 [Coriobacteriia bacterium]
MLVVIVVCALLLGAALGGCAEERDPGASSPEPTDVDAQETAEPEEQTYTSWEVYINDEDSFDKDGITYTIALNLTATNPTPNIAGTYSGAATASTSSIGEYLGAELNASAIANSTTLTFTLKDPTAGGALAPITDEAPADYAGAGSIVMQAAGSGSYAAAAGSFGNTSGQNLAVTVSGTAVTLKVTIDGHEYTFEGTISGK